MATMLEHQDATAQPASIIRTSLDRKLFIHQRHCGRYAHHAQLNSVQILMDKNRAQEYIPDPVLSISSLEDQSSSSATREWL